MFMGNMASYAKLQILQIAVFLLMLPLGKGVSKSYSAPAIKLDGRQLTVDMLFVYQFECSTTTAFHGCSVEMLLNGVTKETIRYSNYTCYNGNGICPPLQCSCSNECNTFSWNYTVKKELKTQIFKCDSRIQDNDFFYKVFASGFFKGGDFIYAQNEVEKVNKNQSTSQKVLIDKKSTVTTVLKEQQNFNDIRGLIIAVLCLVCLNWISFIVCIILLVYFVCVKVREADMKKTEISQEEEYNSEEKQQTCTRRKSIKNIKFAQTCRSNTDKTDLDAIRKTRRSDMNTDKVKHKQKRAMPARKCYPKNVDYDSEDLLKEELRNDISCKLRTENKEKDMYSADVSQDEDDNCEQSAKTQKSQILESSEPLIQTNTMRKGRTRTNSQVRQKQTMSADTSFNKDVDFYNSAVPMPVQIGSISRRSTIHNEENKL